MCVYLAECYQSMCSLLVLGCFVALGGREKKQKKVKGGLAKSNDGENGEQRREKMRGTLLKGTSVTEEKIKTLKEREEVKEQKVRGTGRKGLIKMKRGEKRG